jgi:hypothetical protein
VTELLARSGFRRLLVGQAVSSLGDWMATVALMALVLNLSGSATAVGGVLVLRLLSSMVAGPIAARVTVGLGRRRVMLGADAARVAVSAALPLVGALWWVYPLAFMLELLSLLFLPARDASVPVLVGVPPDAGQRPDEQAVESRLGLANAAVQASSYAAIPLGAAGFGLVYWVIGTLGLTGAFGGRAPYLIVFWLNAATFVFSYLAIRGIALADTDERLDAGSTGSYLAGLRVPLVRTLLPGLVCVAVGLGALFSVGVLYVQQVLHSSPVQFGLMIAGFGVGGCLGLLLRGTPAGWPPLRRVRTGAILQGLTITMMSSTGSTTMALQGSILFGATATVTLLASTGVLQQWLRPGERDLAFAAVHATVRAVLALAALAAGVAADLAPAVDWWISLEPAQVVLGSAGLVVLAGGLLVRDTPR